MVLHNRQVLATLEGLPLTCDSVLCVCVCSRAKGSGSYRERLGGHHLEFKYFTHSL